MSGAFGTRGQITSTSPYGAGPAVVVVAQPLGVTAVGDDPPRGRLALRAAPNPTSGGTRISYDLPRSAALSLSVYDVQGHRVAMLRDRREPAGHGEVVWNGTNDRGTRLPAGVYLVQLIAGSERRVSRLVVLDG
jgi:hypothetical protein